MRRILIVACLAAFAAVACLYAADSSFTGTWKLNPAKSKFTGTIVKYEQKAPGVFTFSSATAQYDFRMDGKEVPGPYGYTVAWKQINDSTWETVTKLKGNVISTERIELSKDGREMTITSTGTKPNGEPFKDVQVMQRSGGGTGLVGSWKSTKVNIGSPDILEIKADAKNAEVDVPAWKVVFKTELNGKDTPLVGPTVPPGLTMALKQTSPRVWDYTQKLNGKTLNVGTMKISPDGKTLTDEGWPPNMKQQTTVAVYEK